MSVVLSLSIDFNFLMNLVLRKRAGTNICVKNTSQSFECEEMKISAFSVCSDLDLYT